MEIALVSGFPLLGSSLPPTPRRRKDATDDCCEDRLAACRPARPCEGQQIRWLCQPMSDPGVTKDANSNDQEQPPRCSGRPPALGQTAHQDGGVRRRSRPSEVNRSQSGSSPGETCKPTASFGNSWGVVLPAALFGELQGMAAETSRGFEAHGSIGRRFGGNAISSQRTRLWSKTLRSTITQRRPTLCGNARNLEVETGWNGERVPTTVTWHSYNRGKSSEGCSAIEKGVEARTPACRRMSSGLETWRTP